MEVGMVWKSEAYPGVVVAAAQETRPVGAGVERGFADE